jgi:hypothetical protein
VASQQYMATGSSLMATLNVAELPVGVYTIRVLNGGYAQSIRFIKE